jgi:hypothetical protein
MFVRHSGAVTEPMPVQAIGAIESHLGGSGLLTLLGASKFVADHEHLSFSLHKANPTGVRTVTITPQPDGSFNMQCHGERAPGFLSAPLVGSATHVVAESLATVLGNLTGVETIHHRHF